jgi:hypothetical protein
MVQNARVEQWTQRKRTAAVCRVALMWLAEHHCQVSIYSATKLHCCCKDVTNCELALSQTGTDFSSSAELGNAIQQELRPAESNPLRDAGILQHIFSFVPGYWLFLGAVCKEWETVYASMAEQQVRNLSLYDNAKPVICGSRSTLYSAAVSSPATARLTISCGLETSENQQLQYVAGLYADVETLSALRELGLALSETVLEAVALSGRLHVLQRLRTEQRCPKPDQISYCAARSGSINMLKWLRAQSWCVFDAATCSGAAAGAHLAAVLTHL